MKDENKNEKEKKSGHPIFILIIFVVLLGFVFKAPDIYKFFNANIAKTLGVGSKEKDNTPTIDTKDDKSPVSEYFRIGSDDTLKYNEITISNATLLDNILSFDVEANNIDLTMLHYYIEFFQEKYTFLGRRALKGQVDSKKRIDIDVSGLNLSNATYFNIAHIEDTSIPKFTLETDESGIGNITCTKNSENYSYDFSLDKLVRVVYKHTYSNDNLDIYSNELLKYKKVANENNNLNGVTALVTDNNGSLIYTLELDYSTIPTFNKITNIYKFNKDELSYIIKYKMDAEGYTCV